MLGSIAPVLQYENLACIKSDDECSKDSALACGDPWCLHGSRGPGSSPDQGDREDTAAAWVGHNTAGEQKPIRPRYRQPVVELFD